MQPDGIAINKIIMKIDIQKNLIKIYREFIEKYE